MRMHTLKFVLVVVGLCLALSCPADGGDVRQVSPRPTVGAIRWDGWFAGNPWEKNLQSAEWRDRLPFYATTAPDGTAAVCSDSQAVIDGEIDYANAAGLDYWAFCYYHPRSWAQADSYNYGWRRFLSSRHKGALKFCFILQWGHLGPADRWPETVQDLIRVFRHPSYFKVKTNRPLVFMFNWGHVDKPFGSLEGARRPIDELRAACEEAGLGNPYIVAQVFSASDGARFADALGFDAIGAYSAHGGSEHREYPYEDLAATNRHYWDSFRSVGKQVVPLVNAGWDGRPRNYPGAWYAAPKPSELATNVRSAFAWVRRHRASCDANTVLIYAWNETDEGGWLVPTISEGTRRLEALKDLLKPRGEASAASVGAVTSQADHTLPKRHGNTMKLHETRWKVDGKPILGTYAAGPDKLDDLRRIGEVGMNVVLGGEEECDPKTPAGAFCLENGIKVMYHLTQFVYHGVKFRDPVAPDRTTIPLFFAHGFRDQASHTVRIDDEIIRYERMTEDGLMGCERGCDGTKPAAHREGVILFWPELCAAAVEGVKSSPNLFGYYVLDDSPGDAASALRALYDTVQAVDPGGCHPVCAGFGNAGSVVNLAPGVCDIMMIYWYPVGNAGYERERTSEEVQHMLTTARARVPGIPFVGVYQAFDGSAAQTGQGVPTGEQLREQLEDFVREGACGLIAFLSRARGMAGWADLPELAAGIKQANEEIVATGGLEVRAETESMKRKRIQPEGHWDNPRPVPGVVPAWYVLAPFQDTKGEMLGAAFPPDQGIDLNAVYPVKFGSARWRVRETTCGVLGLSELYGDHREIENCLAYAFCDVTSPTKQSVQMRICSDDDALIRLNGTEVYRFEGTRGLDYDTDVVRVRLPAGTSRIEAKVHNRAGLWGLFMRFTDVKGHPLEGLLFSPTTG
jgi:hypothetical protein